MTPEQLEALRKGASMEEVLAMAGPGDDAALQAATEAAKLAAKAAAKPTTPGTAPTVDALQAQITELTTAAAAFTGQIEAKTAELEAANGKVATLEAAATAAAAELTASAAAVTALQAALSPYVQKMSVALSKPVDPKGMSAVQLAEAHASLAADFSKAYPAGRQSKATAPASTEADAKVTTQIETAQALNLKF